MRRLFLTLLCGLIAVPAAVAASRATGDGVLDLKAASGSVTLVGTRGTVWGQMDSGTVRVTDPLPGDGAVFVSGAEAVHPLSDTVTIYSGKNIHFRVTGGRYKLTFKGTVSDLPATGIDLTAVGVGAAYLAGDPFVDPGDYSIDDGKWIALPVLQKRVPFGVQPASTNP
jgi:hypothetical protein